jgi:hypothetical protein
MSPFKDIPVRMNGRDSVQWNFSFLCVVVVEDKKGGEFEIAAQMSVKLDDKMPRTMIRSACGRG